MDLPSILETKLSYTLNLWFLFDLANSLIVDLLSNSGGQVCAGLTLLMLCGINLAQRIYLFFWSRIKNPAQRGTNPAQRAIMMLLFS